jgi:hypothetical protein
MLSGLANRPDRPEARGRAGISQTITGRSPSARTPGERLLGNIGLTEGVIRMMLGDIATFRACNRRKGGAPLPSTSGPIAT